jgi:general secretion pathway protein J
MKPRGAGVTRGFTLLELLIAIAIFSVMSVFAYQGLRNFLHARAIVDAQAEAFATLVSGFTLLQQDFEEVAARPVRDALGDAVPALQSGIGAGEVLALTRHTAWTSMATANSDLKRIEYRLQDGALIRRVWAVLDRVPDTDFTERIVLAEVASVSLRYFGEGEWHEAWPADKAGDPLSALPGAISITVRFSNGRAIERMIRVQAAG